MRSSESTRFETSTSTPVCRPPRKRPVEESHRLDLFNLVRQGLFEQPTGTIHIDESHRYGESWSKVACILRLLNGEREVVLFDPPSDPLKSVSVPGYVVRLDWTRPNYGGERPWFLCPALTPQGPCNRRCRILYRPRSAKHFLCRQCHRLTYRTRQLSGNIYYEGHTRAVRAEQRLRRVLDPRCSPRRIWRAVKAAEALRSNIDRLSRYLERV